MDLNSLSTLVSLLAGLSVASERLVEIVKGIFPFINQQNTDPRKEGWRRAALQLLAVAAGIVTVLLAQPLIPDVIPLGWESWQRYVLLGLLASGGSGFWNSILTYLTFVKDTKKLQAASQRAQLPKG